MLPTGWVERMSKSRGRPYYVNEETGERTWTRPQISETPPDTPPGSPGTPPMNYAEQAYDVKAKRRMKSRNSRGERKAMACYPTMLASNFAKEVLMRSSAAIVASLPGIDDNGKARVLDLACGFGADSDKARRAFADAGGELGEYIGIDGSGESIRVAQSQASRSALAREGIKFAYHHHDLRNKLPLEKHGVEMYSCHLVTCMFALHYFFESQESLSAMLDTVHRTLAPGGLFVAIYTDATIVEPRLMEDCPRGGSTKFGNIVIDVDPEDAVKLESSEQFGKRINVTLDGVLDRIPEFVSNPSILEREAQQNGLTPIMDVNALEFVECGALRRDFWMEMFDKMERKSVDTGGLMESARHDLYTYRVAVFTYDPLGRRAGKIRSLLEQLVGLDPESNYASPSVDDSSGRERSSSASL